MSLRILLVPLLLCLPISLPLLEVNAKPYTPTNEFQILEKISTKSIKEIRDLKIQLKQNPQNKEIATSFARKCIEVYRAESDPRYLGYAEGAIKYWFNQKDPDILLIKAIIKQSNHNFNGALNDLSAVIKQDPTNAQAWLTQANILQTIGDYELSKKSCSHLLRLGNQLVSIACISSVSSLNGNAHKSYELLCKIYEEAKNNSSNNERTWVLTILGDTAHRIGNKSQAEKHFKEALNLNPNDNYLLTLYSDFLLEQKKTSEVINLLKDKTGVDNLFLRLVISEKQLNSSDYKIHLNNLNDRFQASRLRSDSIHLREEAIFKLKLLTNPQEALNLAKKNWQTQKEPIDAQILLEAAIETKDKNAAKQVIAFIEKNKLEDNQLDRLISKLKGI